MLKDKLQIIIVTYNRVKFLERTLNSLLADNSPVRNCSILILDNCSSDNTENIVYTFQENNKNIEYIKNNYNIGANANITKAFELNQKEYIWILADDDVYCWDNWQEVEHAISNEEKIIVVSRMDLEDIFKNNKARIITQLAFLSAGIFHKSTLNNEVIRNMYDNIYCMFPHLFPVINLINNNENFYIVDKSIVIHGSYENKHAEDYSFVRGYKNEILSRRSANMDFDPGMAIALSNLNDSALKNETMELLIKYRGLKYPNSRDIKSVIQAYGKRYKDIKDIYYIIDMYLVMDKKYSPIFEKILLNYFGSIQIFKIAFWRFIGLYRIFIWVGKIIFYFIIQKKDKIKKYKEKILHY